MLGRQKCTPTRRTNELKNLLGKPPLKWSTSPMRKSKLMSADLILFSRTLKDLMMKSEPFKQHKTKELNHS